VQPLEARDDPLVMNAPLLEATVVPLTTLPTAHPSIEADPSRTVAPRFTVTDLARRVRV
jgi:hypothetical protein